MIKSIIEALIIIVVGLNFLGKMEEPSEYEKYWQENL